MIIQDCRTNWRTGADNKPAHLEGDGKADDTHTHSAPTHRTHAIPSKKKEKGCIVMPLRFIQQANGMQSYECVLCAIEPLNEKRQPGQDTMLQNHLCCADFQNIHWGGGAQQQQQKKKHRHR